MFTRASKLAPRNIRYLSFIFITLSKLQRYDEACKVAYKACKLINWGQPEENGYRFYKECVFPERAKELREWVAPFVGKADVCFGEIGCFEGLSTCWWLDNVLTHPTSSLVCFDPLFQQNYWHNIKASGSQDKVTANEIESQLGLPGLQPDSLSLLYIDGLHIAWAVLFDFLMSLPAVKTGGLFIFDDYDHADQSGVGQTVKQGVDFIMSILPPAAIKVEHSISPVIFRKISSDIEPGFLNKILTFFDKVYAIDIAPCAGMKYQEIMKYCHNEVVKAPLVRWDSQVLNEIGTRG
nr:class I SAM-dependent methyltransferase [Desulfobaculum xiamenense]